MPSQRPFFLSTFFAAFRQQPAVATQQASKTSSTSPSSNANYATSSSAPRSIAGAAQQQQQQASNAAPPRQGQGSITSQLPIHSPRAGGMPIPQHGAASGRRRGSDSSSEGFRDVIGADKWYIGGRTATGEEKFFKLGVVRRVRSNDRLSLDRLSL